MATHITATAVDAGPRDAAIAEIKALLGDRLTTAKAVRDQHGRDESYHAPAPPDAVAFARSTEEVSASVEEVSAQAEEVTASAEVLQGMAQDLQALVASFKLPE